MKIRIVPKPRNPLTERVVELACLPRKGELVIVSDFAAGSSITYRVGHVTHLADFTEAMGGPVAVLDVARVRTVTR